MLGDGEGIYRREASGAAHLFRIQFRTEPPDEFSAAALCRSMPVKKSRLPVCTVSA